MKVYFSKHSPQNYVIFPIPLNIEDYHVLEIEHEAELEGKQLVQRGEEMVLVDMTPSLVDLREQIRQAINAKRNQTDSSGVFVAQIGKWVDSDDKAYQNILGVKASLDLLGDMEIDWTWADNTSSTINRQTLAMIVGALLQAKQANHANAIKHKEAVMQTDNPLEYDYSTGWTKTYADYVAEASNE